MFRGSTVISHNGYNKNSSVTQILCFHFCEEYRIKGIYKYKREYNIIRSV